MLSERESGLPELIGAQAFSGDAHKTTSDVIVDSCLETDPGKQVGVRAESL